MENRLLQHEAGLFMRLIEGVIFIAVLFMVTGGITSRNKKNSIVNYMPAVNVIILTLHWAVEGLRWQLYPVYLIVILYFANGILKINKRKRSYIRRPSGLKKVGVFLIVLITLVSSALAWAFPVSRMQVPGGPYKIGTVSYELEDPSRVEKYSEGAGSRRIMVQLWYPADEDHGLKRMPWLENGSIVSRGVSRMMRFPDFLFTHTALVKSNSYLDADLSIDKDKYPLVIISHGWTGFKNLHADVAEMLASSGYIVVSIDHTYGSSATVFKDGSAAYLNREALPDRKKTENFLDYANTLVNTYAGDILLTLDSIEGLNSGSMDKRFMGRIDLASIGVMGHSTGGGASVTSAIKDQRIKAVVGLDAWVEPVKEDIIGEGLEVPGLFLRSQQWEESINNENLFLLLESSRDDTALYQIDGTRHNDFTMAYMYSPLSKYLNMTGKLDGRRSSKIQRDFILNFFNRYIKGKSEVSVDRIASQYTEVKPLYNK